LEAPLHLPRGNLAVRTGAGVLRVASEHDRRRITSRQSLGWRQLSRECKRGLYGLFSLAFLRREELTRNHHADAPLQR
jgi:hypothetical protein